jgi:hypothetical protein
MNWKRFQEKIDFMKRKRLHFHDPESAYIFLSPVNAYIYLDHVSAYI